MHGKRIVAKSTLEKREKAFRKIERNIVCQGFGIQGNRVWKGTRACQITHTHIGLVSENTER